MGSHASINSGHRFRCAFRPFARDRHDREQNARAVCHAAAWNVTPHSWQRCATIAGFHASFSGSGIQA